MLFLLPSGERLLNYWKSPLLIGKSTQLWAIFHSHVNLPESMSPCDDRNMRWYTDLVVEPSSTFLAKGLLEMLKDTSSLPEVRVKLAKLQIGFPTFFDGISMGFMGLSGLNGTFFFGIYCNAIERDWMGISNYIRHFVSWKGGGPQIWVSQCPAQMVIPNVCFLVIRWAYQSVSICITYPTKSKSFYSGGFSCIHFEVCLARRGRT